MKNNRKKYLQIFEYLREFSKIRSKAVRDIENSKNYPEILWFSDIPVNNKVDCIAHDDFSNEGEYLLKVSKPKEPVAPIFPKPPKNIEQWINKDSLLNRKAKPELFNEIEIQEVVLKLEDFREVKIEFDEYCVGKWLVDSEKYWTEKTIYDEKYKIYENVNNVYKRLFSIYNKSQQLGEEFELVVGVGLMHFKENDETPLIRRHIITIKAEIEFEFSQRDSNLIISLSQESGLFIETDAVMDLVYQFDSNDILASETKAKEIIKEKELVCPFDDGIHDVLQLIAERIKPGDGSYKEFYKREIKAPDKETVFYAPALILRKRDTKSFTSVYENIIENIEKSDYAYIKSLDDLISIDENEDDSTEIHDVNRVSVKNDIIYFPKKYNDEQVEIIKKARLNDKVLVQGPPGTGKSHTIANLICHLLANGKKVLVTAYTKRALEVLKEKLPEEFKNLTVNLMGGDSSSIKDLEASVNTISDELSNTNVDTLKKEIKSLEQDLANIKEKRAVDTNDLLKIKEKSSRSITTNPAYQGTLTEIAEKLNLDKKEHEWYVDDFSDFHDEKIIEELNSFIPVYDYYSQIDESVFEFKLPSTQKLFDISTFEDFVETASKIVDNNLSNENCNIIETSDFDLLKDYLQDLCPIAEKIEDAFFPEKQEVMKDVVNKNKYTWLNKLDKTFSIVKDLEKYDLRFKDRNIEIKYPAAKTLITLKNDTKILIDYVKSGKSLSGFGFKVKKAFLPSEIKERLYFISEVFVNGSPCDRIDEFEKILDDIVIKQNIEELVCIWGDSSEIVGGYERQITFYKDKASGIRMLIKNMEVAIEKVRLIEDISNVCVSKIEIGEIKQIFSDIENTLILSKYSQYKSQREELISYLSGQKIHTIGNDLSKSLIELDLQEYKIKLADLKKLYEYFQKFDNYKRLHKYLRKIFPDLIDKISNKQFLQSDIAKLKRAILYKNALIEVERLLDSNTENKLKLELKYSETKEEKRIALISAKKSWVHVLDNLNKNKNLRRHLEAWVQAIKKIGKTGKGKRALKFRKVAQKEMEYCKTSVPCWIMPLYKVTETIVPEEGMYDYVIVDEASQLGPDAIFLLYIAKNIIIVGDDKQTSPEYVGVNSEAMSPYIKRYLQDIPFNNLYGIEYSFFDYAKIFCDGVIVLREHFRCMPEIIEFSNKLFYAPEGKGLYPLKQYSENRLEPLMHCYCQNGFVEGKNSYIQNEPEAVAISDKIYEIVNNRKYDGKSIGVICLQGNSQGALIESILVKQIGEKEYNKRKIICGNSASFQGDERDIIFLSLVTAHNHNRSALTRPEDERRFNVAVSRAIEQIWLFHSVLPEDLSNTNDLRYKLLDHFINYKCAKAPVSSTIERTLGNQPEPFDSWFEVDVYNDIVAKGYSIEPQYEVAKGKYIIDMVAFLPDGTKIAIECDGDKWHGADRYQDDMMRQKVLERCGWQFFRIRGGEYYSNKEKSLEPLWKIFTEHECEKPCTEYQINDECFTIKEGVIDTEVCETTEEEDCDKVNEQQCVLNFKDEELENQNISHNSDLEREAVVATVDIVNKPIKSSVEKNIIRKELSDFKQELVEEINGVKIAKYSPKSIVVFGKTKEIKDELKALDGYFNPYLKWEDKRILGWIFKPDRLKEVVDKVKELKGI